MFIEVFEWICSCISSIFEVMKKFVLFDDFTFFHLLFSIMAVSIIFKIIHFIMGIEDEEANIQPRGNYITQYDGYVPKHAKEYVPRHAQYSPRHEKKKWRWF